MKVNNWVFISVAFFLFGAGCTAKTKVVDSCGDGVLDPGEECDGTVGENTCGSLGHYHVLGTLGCRSDCTFDRSGCGGRCGDNAVDADDGETCDGIQLSGQSCQSLGYGGGVLSCDEGCQLDISGCVNACGNGYLEGEEACDDGGRQAGDGCATDCTVEYGWECDGMSPSTCTRACIDEELCDGLDNDCDGTIDNGPEMECELNSSRPCGPDEGSCVAGTEYCNQTCQWTGVCEGGTGPTEELCDNQDNDCDGVVDGTTEAPQLYVECNLGCGPGLALCVNGSYSGCDAPLPTDEICDGLDNDCDGSTDEGLALGVNDNDDSCASASPYSIEEGDLLEISGKGIYHTDLSGDVDFLRVGIQETNTSLCTMNPTHSECFSYVFSLTDPPDLDLEFDVILVPPGATDAEAQCLAMDPGNTFHSVNGSLVVHYDGSCMTDDNPTAFVRVFSVSGGISCHPYQLTVSVPISIISEASCDTYP